MVVPIFVPANCDRLGQSSVLELSIEEDTYVAKNNTEEAHASYRANGTGLGDPMVPAIGEHRYPSFGDESLNQHEHC